MSRWAGQLDAIFSVLANGRPTLVVTLCQANLSCHWSRSRWTFGDEAFATGFRRTRLAINLLRLVQHPTSLPVLRQQNP